MVIFPLQEIEITYKREEVDVLFTDIERSILPHSPESKVLQYFKKYVVRFLERNKDDPLLSGLYKEHVKDMLASESFSHELVPQKHQMKHQRRMQWLFGTAYADVIDPKALQALSLAFSLTNRVFHDARKVSNEYIISVGNTSLSFQPPSLFSPVSLEEEYSCYRFSSPIHTVSYAVDEERRVISITYEDTKNVA